MRSFWTACWAFRILILSALASVVLAATDLTLQDAKLSVSSIDGSSRLSESFSLTRPPKTPSPLSLESDEVLRLSFTLRDANGDKLSSDQLPHQVVVSLTDAQDTTLSATSVVNVKRASGKASWSQRMDRLPLALLRGSEGGAGASVANRQVHATLYLGSFGEQDPVRLPLVTLAIPETLQGAAQQAPLTARQRKEIEQGFRRHADHHHTFAVPAAEQMPPRIVSLAAALGTLVVPWLVLLALFSRLAESLHIKSPPPATLPFLASLGGLELLALMYWYGLGLTLFKMLPWLMMFTLASILAGRNALTEMRRVRLGKRS